MMVIIWLTGLTGYGIMIIATQEYHCTYGHTAEVIVHAEGGNDTGISFKVKRVGGNETCIS